MNDLMTIICNRHESLEKKIKESQEYLNDNKEIVINKELFILALLNIIPINGDLINKSLYVISRKE